MHHYTSFVAAAIAEKDSARAVALADAMAGNGPYPDRTKTEIASRIGADRPDEAIRIIEGMNSFAADYMRAEAFAWLAIAVAPRDRPRAFALHRTAPWPRRSIDRECTRAGSILAATSRPPPTWPPPRGRSATRTWTA